MRRHIEKIAGEENKQYYIILDEIQLVDDFVRAVNSLNKHKNYDLYITGSKEYYIQVMDAVPVGKHLNNEYDALLAVPGSFKKIVVINKPL